MSSQAQGQELQTQMLGLRPLGGVETLEIAVETTARSIGDVADLKVASEAGKKAIAASRLP